MKDDRRSIVDRKIEKLFEFLIQLNHGKSMLLDYLTLKRWILKSNSKFETNILSLF